MELFDNFTKKNKIEKASDKTEEINAPGWDAIDELCDKVYPNQKNSKHYGTLISWEFGGNDPLQGISVYDGGDYWHFITYGLSELYEKESEIKEVSGYGMELTFKLKKDNYENEENEIKCVCGILRKRKSNITGFITVPDDKFPKIDTPNGKVCFVEFVGVTDSELKAIQNKEIRVKELYEKIGSDVTNYNRKSVI